VYKKFSICNCARKKIVSGILLKDFKEEGIFLKKGTPLFIELIGSDLGYNDKYKIHLSIGIDIKIIN